MKKITKSMLTLALLLAGTVSASAQTEVHATFESPTGITWDADNKTFSWDSQWGNQLHNIGLPNGNITKYEKVVVDCEILEGDGYRIMFYATTKGTTAGGVTVITESGKKEFILKDFGMDEEYLTQNSEFCLSGYNASGKVKVNDVYFVESADPLAGQKTILSDKITLAKMQSSLGKTEDSFNALQTEIGNAEDAYAASDATEESLIAAADELQKAIDGLKLSAGYMKLDQNLYNTPACTYAPFTANGLPYGHGSVPMDNYAELASFDKLIVKVVDGKPRFCMNRLTSDGQIGATLEESNMIDINPQGDYAGFTWATEKYQTIDEDNKEYTINLKTIAADYDGSARLHSIKGSNYSNVTVTDMLLYRTVNVAEKYATFGVPQFYTEQKGSHIEGATVYEAKYDEGKIKLTELTSGDVPAGKGVIVMGAGNYEPTFDVEVSDMDSELMVSDGTVAGDGSTIYVLTKKDGKFGFAKMKEGVKVPAGKCYLVIPAESREFIGFETETTGIETVGVAEAQKAVFNLAGQRLMKAQKGVNVINGKKVVMK